MDVADHWKTIYQSRTSSELSWFKPHLSISLEMIAGALKGMGTRIIDIGGGDSTLVDDLVGMGLTDITVLDIAAPALVRSRQRLADTGHHVTWMEDDVLRAVFPHHHYDLWHDRAVFHFFTEDQSREKYAVKASNAVRPDGQMIIATFADDGPLRCSGLPTMRYSPDALAGIFQQDFVLVESRKESHLTPQGKEQRFVYCRFRRKKVQAAL